MLDDAAALALERDQSVQIEPGRIGHRAARIGGGNEARTLPGEEAGGVLAHGAEALDGNGGAVERGAREILRHLEGGDEAVARGADLVEGNAADLGRQARRAPGLVHDPGHAALVRPHVGPGDVIGDVGDRAGEGAHEALLLGERHLGVAEDHRLGAAVGQAGGGILEGHGAREAEGFLRGHVGRQPRPADGRAAGGVVHRDHGPQARRRAVDMDDPGGAEIVAEPETLIHHCLHGSVFMFGFRGPQSGQRGTAPPPRPSPPGGRS